MPHDHTVIWPPHTAYSPRNAPLCYGSYARTRSVGPAVWRGRSHAKRIQKVVGRRVAAVHVDLGRVKLVHAARHLDALGLERLHLGDPLVLLLLLLLGFESVLLDLLLHLRRLLFLERLEVELADCELAGGGRLGRDHRRGVRRLEHLWGEHAPW